MINSSDSAATVAYKTACAVTKSAEFQSIAAGDDYQTSQDGNMLRWVNTGLTHEGNTGFTFATKTSYGQAAYMASLNSGTADIFIKYATFD